MEQEPYKAEQQQEKTLGQRVREARIEQKWSQDVLAEKVGVDVRSVIRWENDQSIPRGDSVRLALIEVLGLRKEDFTQEKRVLLEPQNKEKPSVTEETENDKLAAMRIAAVKEKERVEGRARTVEETKHEETPVIEQEENESTKEEIQLPVAVVLPYEHWHVPLPPPEALAGTEFIEYKIPHINVYRGFFVSVWHKQYGYFRERRVTVNGKRLMPYDIWVDTPFGWGHTGGGPRRLAEAILLDYFETMYPDEPEEVLRSWVDKYSYNFKMDFTAWFDKVAWEIWSGAITAWLKEQKEHGDPAPEHTLDDIGHGWRGWWHRWDKYKGT